jgi:hypothetical protein
MDEDFKELQLRSEENLVTFLRVEVDLASTFCGMAERTDDLVRRARLLENIQKVVSAIRQFEGRVTDQFTRADLNREANRLDMFLVGFQNSPLPCD